MKPQINASEFVLEVDIIVKTDNDIMKSLFHALLINWLQSMKGFKQDMMYSIRGTPELESER